MLYQQTKWKPKGTIMLTTIFTLAAVGLVTILFKLYQVAVIFQNKKATRLAKRAARKEKVARPRNFYQPDVKDAAAARRNTYSY